MKHEFVAIIMLIGSLLWMVVWAPPISAQSGTPGQFSGNASWYGVPFHGRKTASGEIFNMNKLTGAHLRLPLPTRVMVENPRNGNTVVIKINDRGPYAKNRVMDLSREGARQLGTLSMGVGYVECMVLPKVNSNKVNSNKVSSSQASVSQASVSQASNSNDSN